MECVSVVYLVHKRRAHRRLFSNKVNLKVQSSQCICIHLLKIMFKLGRTVPYLATNHL
jgi:hypothetical protein